MKIRTKLLIGFAAIAALVTFMLSRWVLDDLRPRYMEMMEEGLVEQVNILAALLETQLADKKIDAALLEKSFDRLIARKFRAKIYALEKIAIDQSVYVTDSKGIVIFDSKKKNLGSDFSSWNNIVRTLRGDYGARSTRKRPDDPTSSILHISAPIMSEAQIVGVVTIAKPVTNAYIFINMAKQRFAKNVVICSLIAFVVVMILAHVVTKPVRQVTEYALKVRDGQKAVMPSLGKGEAGQLARTLEQMVVTLEGKKYVETYLETLTHELKSPLAATFSAAELLKEDPPLEARQKFTDTVLNSSLRMQQSVDQLLELSRIENMKSPDRAKFNLNDLAQELIDHMNVNCENKIKFRASCPESILVSGERSLLKMALLNLFENSRDFSCQGTISMTVKEALSTIEIKVIDEGVGIPDYATEKIIDRFYSLPRPDTNKRSTGLGLSLVSRIADLHGGSFTINNRMGHAGVEATLIINN